MTTKIDPVTAFEAATTVMTTIDSGLHAPGKLSTGLETLSDSLAAVEFTLTVVSLMPEVAPLVDGVKTAAGTLGDACQSGSTKLHNVDETLEPFYKVLDPIVFVMGGIVGFIELQAFLKSATASDSLSRPQVHLYDDVRSIQPMLTKVSDDLSSLEDALKKIEPIESTITKINSDLDDLTAALKPVKAVLDQDISIPYTVNVSVDYQTKEKVNSITSVLGWVWHTVTKTKIEAKTKYHTYTVREIYNGIEGIGSGLKQALEAAAEKAVNNVLGALKDNLGIDLTIPGLSEIDNVVTASKDKLGYDDLNDLFIQMKRVDDDVKALRGS